MRKGRDGEKTTTYDYSGHYVIASSQPPERRQLERRTLVPKSLLLCHSSFLSLLSNFPDAVLYNSVRHASVRRNTSI